MASYYNAQKIDIYTRRVIPLEPDEEFTSDAKHIIEQRVRELNDRRTLAQRELTPTASSE